MHRPIILAAALLCLGMPATAQGLQTPQLSGPASPATLLPLQAQTASQRLAGLPVQPLPYGNAHIRHRLQGSLVDFGAATDTLSEEQILRRIGRVYRYQSNLLLAQAEGDAEQVARLLELAMTELATLLQQPDIMEHPRFRELYRTVITEYEGYYGASDSLAIERGDIFQFRADLFAALDEGEVPLLEDVMRARLQPMETVFPMTMNRLVEQSIAYLLREPNKHLYRWLSRAETYFPMIERVLAEEGVPDELKYLAMVESGLNPAARSWAQAAGMWQFIAATGRAYGLHANAYMDERLDPEKSTRAAARHLRDLHQLFGGDWQLALAGYNCSPARIKRAIRRAETRLGRKATFWDIYHDIPRETRNYVPMFIAAALVTSNPEAFNVPEVTPGPRYEYDRVPVHGLFSLHTIAEFAGTDVATLRALNPELKRSVTPPSRGAYYVRLPLGTYDRFAEHYAALPAEERRSSTEYVVRRGDVLGQIASRYGVSASALMRTNGLRSTTIHPGQRLIVPVPDQAHKGVDLADAKPMRVQYTGRVVRPIAAAEPPKLSRPAPSQPEVPIAQASDAVERPSPPPQKPATSETRVVYQVRRGDTLGRIARRYGVSIGEIKTWNDLSGSTIRTGQRLYLYTEKGPAAEPAAERTVYRVRRGDTLSEIARRHGVKISDLQRWNNLQGSTIRAGQHLYLYSGAASVVVYQVRRGDTLTKIASEHGVQVSDLKRWNNLRSSTIRPGQKLKIHT